MTSGGAECADTISVFADEAVCTTQIMLGTAITQTCTRHSIAVAQHVLALAQLTPQGFRLGIGTNGPARMK